MQEIEFRQLVIQHLNFHAFFSVKKTPFLKKTVSAATLPRPLLNFLKTSVKIIIDKRLLEAINLTHFFDHQTYFAFLYIFILLSFEASFGLFRH